MLVLLGHVKRGLAIPISRGRVGPSLEQQLEAGTHPRQQALTTTIERPDYPAKLLAALDRFEHDPETHWRVTTYPTPAGCETLFDWGIDRFGTPGRFFAYCRTLPASPWQSLRGRPRESQRLRAA